MSSIGDVSFVRLEFDHILDKLDHGLLKARTERRGRSNKTSAELLEESVQDFLVGLKDLGPLGSLGSACDASFSTSKRKQK